jgi:hypothetical protein
VLDIAQALVMQLVAQVRTPCTSTLSFVEDHPLTDCALLIAPSHHRLPVSVGQQSRWT